MFEVVEQERRGSPQDDSLLSGERYGMKGAQRSLPRGGEPEFPFLRGPREALHARPSLRERPRPLAIRHHDRSSVVASSRVIDEGDEVAAGGYAWLSDPTRR